LERNLTSPPIGMHKVPNQYIVQLKDNMISNVKDVAHFFALRTGVKILKTYEKTKGCAFLVTSNSSTNALSEILSDPRTQFLDQDAIGRVAHAMVNQN